MCIKHCLCGGEYKQWNEWNIELDNWNDFIFAVLLYTGYLSDISLSEGSGRIAG